MDQKDHVIDILKELHSFVPEDASPAVISHIEEEIKKLEENLFYLVVLGQFKRGKTTLINALLGEKLLPSGILPLTSVITLIRFGEIKNASVIFEDNRRYVVDTERLYEYISEQSNPNNKKGVKFVEISYPSSFLQDGIVLVDTPGIGSVSIHNTITTKEFLPHIDAAVVVLAADPPITQVEYEFFDELFTGVNKVFFLLNKIDTMSQADLAEALAYTKKTLMQKTGDEVDLIPVSALATLKDSVAGVNNSSHAASLENLKRAIQSFLGKDKLEHLLRGSQKRVHRLIGELQFSGELRLKAVEMPLRDLQEKIRLFNQFMNSINNDRERHIYIMDGEIAALRRWLSERVETMQREENIKLQNVLSERVTERRELSSRELLPAVEKELMTILIEDFEKWRPPLERELVGRLQTISQHTCAEINKAVEQLVQHSARLFDIALSTFPAAEVLPLNETLSYKVKDDPLFIEIDMLEISARFLPRGLVRRRILRHLKDKVAERIMLNCGRVLSGLVSLLDNNQRHIQDNLEQAVENVVGDIGRILTVAVQQKEKDETLAQTQLSFIRQYLQLLRALEMRLDQNL
ncbi:MAG TPA: dynamin family protein [Bacteroidota bacterium]|nr:dynamin family protein [Bacteroidota bacterium]